ncbi:hypothetical protein BGX26_003550 [Mortierella sp. AD094]|nr:hypothetical protein BGX26_003550 [Mortierella sp. AD094]
MLSLLLCAEGKAKLWDTCMEDILAVHGQSLITHVLWNHSGNYFTTIDEKGKIVIWGNRYVASKSDGTTKYEREKTGRPRSPLALIVLTSDGLLTTLFKPAGQVFTHISTNLPQRFVSEDVASSRITHGSILSGVDGTHLVTHSSNILPSTVNVYQIDLRFTPEALFRCDALAILHISNPVTGPGSMMTPGVVLHLQLLPQTSTRPYSVAVALASREENPNGEITYRSQIAVWDVTPKLMGFHPAFQELSTRRNDAVSGQPSLTFVMIGERRFENKFISAVTFVPRSRELVIGFSDGSILGLESRFTGLLDSTPTLLDGFHVGKGGKPIVAICPSPNGLNLVYTSLSGQISNVSTSEISGYDLDLEASIQYAVLALLNEWDYSDIVAVIVKASKVAGDSELPDRFLEGVFKSYEWIKGAEDSKALEPFLPKASVMRRMLSLQLVLLQALPNKIVQFRATCALLHLQSIGEVFSGCCTSDPATLAAHLDPGSNVTTGQKTLAFDTNSLWSLFPLCGWTLDFCTVLFRELAVFLNMKSASSHGPSSVVPQGLLEGQSAAPANSAADTGAPTPSLLCFLYHSRARKTLRSVLVLVEQFYLFVRFREQLYLRIVQTGSAVEAPSGQGQEKGNHTNSMSIPEAVAMKDIQITFLSQYVEAAYTRCPLKVGVVKSMLRDLNGIGNHLDPAKINGGGAGALQRPVDSGVLDKTATDHVIFIKGMTPSFSSSSLAQAKTELRMIIRRYPTLWDMNRLIFATIHWLDLEPADKLIESKTSSRQKALAMHPARCRIDPATALRARVPGGVAATSGRTPIGALQHHPSNVSSSNMSVVSRGSISSASGRGGIPSRVFTESPGELPLSQQTGQQMRSSSISQPFADVSSVMATTGSVSHNRTLDFGGSLTSNAHSIWGLVLEENDDESSTGHSRDDREEEIESLKSIWQNLGSTLQGQQLVRNNAAQDDGVETVPDDDILLEEDGDEDDENQDSDEDMQDSSINNNSRRNSVGIKDNILGASRGRRASLATLAPPSQWLIQESQAISKKTRAEWTVFPIISDERPSTGVESEDAKSRMAMLGLSGHFAPLDLQPTEFQTYTQSEIEAQVRKRRFGVDPIRKVKKYKTTANGRRCIRCLQVATSNSANAKPIQRRTLPHQIGSSPNIIPDIAAATLWYHNYDRSCICGGMWLEL